MRYCTRCFSVIDDESDHCEHCARGDSLILKIISQTLAFAVLLGFVLNVTYAFFAFAYSVSNDEIDRLHEQNSKSDNTYQSSEIYW